MKCRICGSVQIKGDCQYINGYYYHNRCIEKLTQENKELHNKIDKAIEYTKKHSEDAGYLDVREVKGLLEILKGDVK